MIREVTFSQWTSGLRTLGPRMVHAAKRGALSGALRSIAEVQKATRTAPSASGGSGEGGAVNTGTYLRSWRARPTERGSILENRAPYAGVIELGRRRGAFPPSEAIARWAQRRLGLSREEALRAAFPIARAIANRGLQARNVMTGVLDRMSGIVSTEIAREVRKELGGVA